MNIYNPCGVEVKVNEVLKLRISNNKFSVKINKKMKG